MTGYEYDVLMEWWFMQYILLPTLFVFGLLFTIGILWYLQWRHGIFYWGYRFIRTLPKRIKWWFQRRIRGYSNLDLYNLELFWTETILKTLKSFKKMKRYGVPVQSWPNGTPEEKAVQAWEQRIDELISGFQEYYDSQVGSFRGSWQEENKISLKFQNETLPKLQEDWFKFWD